MKKTIEVNLPILKKYFENKCTPEEVQEITDWLNQTGEPTDLDDEFRMVWENLKLKHADPGKWKDKLTKIHEHIEMEELYSTLKVKDVHKGKVLSPQVKTVAFHPDNSQNSARNTWKYIMAAAAVFLVVFTWIFTYQNENQPETSPVASVVTKSTEPGQKLTIQLSDGSRVILNSASKLTYNDYFGTDQRVVYLEGEAFFEVNRDTLRPFSVIAGNISTTALGTSFNINSFSEDKAIEIALVSGKVLVEQQGSPGNETAVYLLPGEKATYDKQAGDLTKSNFNVRDITCWKDGILAFRNAGYKQITEKLEKWYGVEITENKAPVKDWRFTGAFENENLENLLNTLRFEYGFHYNIDRKKVYINFN